MILIYILTKNREEAVEISKSLISKELTHSVNILPEIFSFRREGDDIVEYTETITLVKTKAILYRDIEEHVGKLQKTESPMIFSLPITQINRDLFKLIQQNTAQI